jgi:hypothetical protein
VKRAFLSSLVWAASLAACNVTEVPLAPSAITENQCESSDDCPGSTTCLKREGQEVGACAARVTTVADILIQVTPPATFPALGGLSFYEPLEKISGGEIALVLDQVAHVEGHVDLAEAGCRPAYIKGQTIPVDVSFTPSEQLLGIPTAVYSASVNENADPDRHYFVVEIPAGEYDIYIKPKPTTDCELPPQLLLNYRLAGNLGVNLPVPSTLDAEVYWPDGSLEGSSVAMLDEETGRLISTEPQLGTPEYAEAEGAYRYSAKIYYFAPKEPEEPGKSGTDPDPEKRSWVLRLKPPPGVERPSLLGQSLRVLEQRAALPANVLVKGQTAISGKTVPVEATLKITATELEGFDAGVLAAYSRTVSVPPEGLFELSLPPGTYNVEATPLGASAACSDGNPTEAAPCLAVAKTSWKVGIEPPVQAGKVIELPHLTVVSGHAVLWSGGAPMGATVRVTGSPAGVQSNLVDAYLGVTQPLPRTASSLVRADASFSFGTDPGVFDLIVQTDPATRFGWYVWPVGFPEVIDSAQLTMQAPVVYTGRLSVGSGGESKADIVIPNALIRAYGDADGNTGGHRIPIAETWSNDQGAFELLIPRQLGPAPTKPAN